MCSVISAVSTTCIFSEFIEEKNRTCSLGLYFSRLERQRISLSLSLSLSNDQTCTGSKYVEPALNHEMVRPVLPVIVIVKCRITFITKGNYCCRMWNSKH